MLAIAEAFLTLFEDESEEEIYWLFSNFMKKFESHSSKEDMVSRDLMHRNINNKKINFVAVVLQLH